MRKILNKIGIVCLMFVLVFNCNIIEIVAENSKYEVQLNTAQKFIQDVLKSDQYERIIELYGINDTIDYLFFDLNDEGYVILDIATNQIIEAGFDRNNFIIEDNVRYYYNGPFEYYIKDNGLLIDLQSNEKIEKESLKKFEFSQMSNETIDASDFQNITRANVEYSVYLQYSLPNYTYVQDGTCGSTAAAMFLEYYDDFTERNFVPSYLDPEVLGDNGNELIERLIYYIDSAGGVGSLQNEVEAGMENYLSSIGVTYDFTTRTYSAGILKTKIKANRPVIICTSTHWSTVYGYYIDSNQSVPYVHVNTGLGTTGIVASSAIEAMVY